MHMSGAELGRGGRRNRGGTPKASALSSLRKGRDGQLVALGRSWEAVALWFSPPPA